MSAKSSERQAVLLLGALLFALYLRTLAPGLLAGDPGEFQFAAWSLGLAHPTGYPFYLMVGSLWQHGLALVGLSPAWSLNALSALCSALAAALTYRVQINWITEAHHTSSPISRPIVRAAALVSALFFGLNPTFWNQSLIAEVYSLHLLFVVLIVLAAQRLILATRKEGAKIGAFLSLALVVGLALTHHAMIVWLLPGLLLYLMLNRSKIDSLTYPVRVWRRWIGALILVALPLLLYLYIPLRSGPTASPWFHQPLGDGTLSLYENSWAGFTQYISGQSISVGFRSWSEAVAQLSFALEQWHIHFTLLGLLLVALGLFSLVKGQHWSILAWTSTTFLLQQGFNLFYNIGDIFVYYIPLYWIGAIWAGFGAAFMGQWVCERVSRFQRDNQHRATTAEGDDLRHESGNAPPVDARAGTGIGVLLVLALLLIPIRQAQRYYPQIDQSGNNGTQLRWDEILGANPPENAILVSNDRNEIVPLFYYQQVEGKARSMTGLFPLIAPGERFADIGATVVTALTAAPNQPIYLIKPMPGLEARFSLAARTPPLVQVMGDAITEPPKMRLDLPYGPLTLLGYDWVVDPATPRMIQISLQWQVNSRLADDFTGTLQLYDDIGERIAQDDQAPGGLYYPTSLWKPNETLSAQHRLTVADGKAPTAMLVGLYAPNTLAILAPPLEIPLPLADSQPNAPAGK